MEQKSRTFARKGIADIFERPGYRDFFLDLGNRPERPASIHVSRLDIGDTCAAANLGIVFGDCYYHVLASYSDGSAVAQYGPGALHLRELMAYAIGRGLKRFDFTIGDEPYKLEWSDTYARAVRFCRRHDLARPAGGVDVIRAAADQALYQTDAGAVAPRLRGARGDRSAIAAAAAMKRHAPIFFPHRSARANKTPARRRA